MQSIHYPRFRGGLRVAVFRLVNARNVTMHPECAPQSATKMSDQGFNPARKTGFSILELVVVLAIAMVMVIMAIPAARSAVATYQLDAAADGASGAIQAARYQAIMHGYPYQVNLNSTNNQYQILNEVPPATTFS